jgi:hypothetical protein
VGFVEAANAGSDRCEGFGAADNAAKQEMLYERREGGVGVCFVRAPAARPFAGARPFANAS